MVEQAYVQPTDVTNPTVANLQARIATAIDNNPAPGTGTVLNRVKFWLQLPKASMFHSGMVDADCDPRSKGVGSALSAPAARYDSADLSAPGDVAAKWAGISSALHGDRAVTLKGPTDHVGGEKSLFKQDNGSGFHVIVLLATGNDSGPGGRPFFLVFDPDVSATDAARRAWVTKKTNGDTVAKVSALTEAEAIAQIKLMLLGAQGDVFGPLIRKYYFDTAAGFPAILRVGTGD
ncbi:hypothetical protein K353_01020 [Kitasatospora sp. SolWspMP-SS2h]|nr:hypothetical protein K353_01020 [Kitasatospora sp. SolWspMP-SS2h]